MDRQKNQNRQNYFEKNKVTGFTLPDFTTQLIKVIKTAQNWQKDSQKINETESRNIYALPIFDKDAKTTQ